MQRAPSTAPQIPGYEYIRLLGAGGFSDVFLYEQKLPKRRVAVKVLLLEELTDSTRAAFVAEANLMAQLSAHPYIVTIFHADVATDGRPYFVMEYCSGASLGERYKRETFAVADALRTGVRLSSAIATAHSAGILHRDIKPANVLTNDYGWPALTDFGISSTVDEEIPLHTMTSPNGAESTSGGTTGTQSVGMSVPWSPPEMFEDDPQPDVRSDVFSLAATIHTLLAGRTPFEIKGRSNGTLDLIGRIERGAITPIGRDDVPRSLVAVLQKGMASRRSERFASATEFARALQRVELELGYAPTNLEIPNLEISEFDRSEPVGGDDETRVRSVATIAAQAPVAPASAPAAPIIPPQPKNDDETRIRPVTTIAPAPAATHAPVDEGTVVRGAASAAPVGETVIRPKRGAEPEPEPVVEAAPAKKSKRNLIIGIVAGVAALALAGVLIASVVTAGGDVREAGETEAPVIPGGPAVLNDVIPVPVDGTAKASNGGKTVTFSWKNPDAQDGDSYRYARSEKPGERMPLEKATVKVTGLAKGATTCIDAYVYRTGKLSADPLTICYPEK